MLDLIKKRRSLRVYTREPVSDRDVQAMLEAAMAAPSAVDARPWEVVVVRQDDSRHQLAKVHPWAHMCAGAPMVFVILGDPARSAHWVEDCSALTENLLLEASALGLGAVWVAIYPHPLDEGQVRQIVGAPEHLRVLCVVPVGHPAESRPPHTKFDEQRVHYDRYGE